MCMKRNVVSRETGFPARLQLIENGKGSVLALSGRLWLSHDVYDSKAVDCERGVAAPPDGLACSSLSRGYSLVIIRGVLEGMGSGSRGACAGERQTAATPRWGIRRAAVGCGSRFEAERSQHTDSMRDKGNAFGRHSDVAYPGITRAPAPCAPTLFRAILCASGITPVPDPFGVCGAPDFFTAR